MVDFNKLREMKKNDREYHDTVPKKGSKKNSVVLGAAPVIPHRVTPKIYTAQFSHASNPGADLLKPYVQYDITYSGLDLRDMGYLQFMTPDWWLVAGHKRYHGDDNPKYQKFNPVSDEQYVGDYTEILNRRYAANPQRFWDCIATEYPLVLYCFCGTGKFCHRHIAKDWLRNMAQSRGFYVIDGGELMEAIKAEKRSKTT